MKRNNLTHDDNRSSCYESITIHTLVVFLNKWRLTELTGLRVTRILLLFYNMVAVRVWGVLIQSPRASGLSSSSQDSDSDVVPCHQALPDASMDACDAYWGNTCITFKLLIEGGVLCVASFEQSLVIPRVD